MDSTDSFFIVTLVLIVLFLAGYFAYNAGLVNDAKDWLSEQNTRMIPGVYAKSMINGEEVLIPVVEENMTQEDLERGLEAGVLVEVR